MIQLTDNDTDSEVNIGDMVDTKDHGTGVLESLYEGKLNIRVGKELFTVHRNDCKKSTKAKPVDVINKNRDFNQLAQDPVKLPLDPNAEYSPHSTTLEEKKVEENRQIQRDRLMEQEQIAQAKRQEESNLAVKKEEEVAIVNEAAKKELEKKQADEAAQLTKANPTQPLQAQRVQPPPQVSNTDRILAEQKEKAARLQKERLAKEQEEKKNEQVSD